MVLSSRERADDCLFVGRELDNTHEMQALRRLLKDMLDGPAAEQLVVLGETSIHGSLLKVPALAERLQLAMDNGAKRVLIPSENKRDFADVPSDVLDKLQIISFSDPVSAAFRAMGVD